MFEFAYNNHIHSLTNQTPFMVDTGHHLQMGFEPLFPSHIESVNTFRNCLSNTLEEAKASITKAQDDMKQFYDTYREPTPEYKVGEKVMLDSKNISTMRPLKKLDHKFYGPFQIISKVGTHAYRLDLPLSMKRVHPVFHVVRLR